MFREGCARSSTQGGVVGCYLGVGALFEEECLCIELSDRGLCWLCPWSILDTLLVLIYLVTVLHTHLIHSDHIRLFSLFFLICLSPLHLPPSPHPTCVSFCFVLVLLCDSLGLTRAAQVDLSKKLSAGALVTQQC